MQASSGSETMIKDRGFLAIEYVVLIAIVVIALLGMQLHIKRAICGRWRSAADGIGFGRQYQPGLTEE